jgi:hypothetical protein
MTETSAREAAQARGRALTDGTATTEREQQAVAAAQRPGQARTAVQPSPEPTPVF